MSTSLINFQQYCFKNNLSFVSYTMPGCTNVPITLFAQNEHVQTYLGIEEVNITDGFLMAPFYNADFRTVVIPATNSLQGWEVKTDPINWIGVPASYTNIDNTLVSQDDYEKQVLQIKQQLHEGKAQKVVLSRIKKQSYVDAACLPLLFKELTNAYPHAFVYIISTPQTGIWIGATPETLVQTDKESFSTIALAGTKAVLADGSIKPWSDKNLKEQEYVEAHIRQTLQSGGYTFNETERQTINAGNVEHLGTIFNGSLKGQSNEWKQLVSLLHPTPAICGTPTQASLEIIKKVEKHKRAYYTGYLGPVKANESRLFINLRCMQYANQSAYFYAGGGIIDESVESKEWNETELKFNTLGAVLNKVLNAEPAPNA